MMPSHPTEFRMIGKLWVAICVMIACAAGRLSAAPADRPPNIVFILIDDMGWRDVGCNGSRFYETPNIDRLAKSGMRFTNAYAACPVCSPSRAAILTGKYPARLHLTDWLPGMQDKPAHKLLRPQIIEELPLEENNLAKALKAAGYHSASIGKWHLGGPNFWPDKQGFDLNVGGTQTGSPPGGYFNFHNAMLKANDPDEYLTDRLTAEAEKFIDANKDGPFFLYLAHYAVHIPLQAKQRMMAHYTAKISRDDPQNNALYAAMVQSVDESVGRVVAKIDSLGLTSDTLIVFTSDNGGLSVHEGPNTPSTSNDPLRAGKGYLYEGGIREPCIVSWPGIVQPGSVCDTPVCGIDFYPTLLTAAGGKPNPGQIIDGINMIPLLKQTGVPDRAALYWHYPHYSDQGGRPGGAVRQGDWKLIEYYEDNRVELYNVAKDLSEKDNLAPQMPDKAEAMLKLLHDWRKSVDAQLNTPNPQYVAPKASVEVPHDSAID
jgi:arylsulfatase A